MRTTARRIAGMAAAAMLSAFLALVGCGGGGGGGGAPPPPGAIDGYVLEYGSRAGIPGLAVYAGGQTAHTDASGCYQLASVEDSMPLVVSGQASGMTYRMITTQTVLIGDPLTVTRQAPVLMAAAPPIPPSG